MIKLTINPGSQPTINEFDKKIVVIGCAGSGEADLTIPGEKLQPAHIRIIEKDGTFTVFNVANDPFVTLNDLPFGKKTLRSKDILQIGKTLVLFEGSMPPKVSEKPLDTAESLVAVVEHNIAAKKPPKILTSPMIFTEEEEEDIWEGHAHFDPANEISRLEEETGFFTEEETVDVDNLLRQVEQIEQQATAPAPKPQAASENAPRPLQTPKPQQPSVKQTAQPAQPAEPPPRRHTIPENEPPARPTVHPLRSRRLWIAIAIALLSFLAVVAGGAYNRLLSQGQQTEVTAMQGVADVVMALTYAQINNLKPEQSNWSNPEFLQKGIAGVLSKQFGPLVQVDKQGQFANSSYLLRIYTSRDLTRFLVIAQPEASLQQWLAPRHSIVVDSDMMELRKISDLRPLNRILVNADSLSGANGREVTKLVLNGELVPLSVLAGENNEHGFEPPKALALLRPGAEHLVYNAPRYSRVGEKFLRAAVDIASRPTEVGEMRRLQDQAKMIAALPDAVLYTTQGMSAAIQSQQALAALSPGQRFLIAFVRFNDKGKLTGSQLLTDSIASAHQAALPLITYAEPLAEATETLKHVPIESPIHEKPHNVRMETLQPISFEINALLERNNKAEVPQFNILFLQLVEKYLAASTHLQEEEKQAPKFQNEISPAQEPIPPTIKTRSEKPEKNHEQQTKAPRFDSETYNKELQQIMQAGDIQSLAQHTQEANHLLKNATAAQKTELQEEMQRRVLDKLSSFLLTAEEALPAAEYTQENRGLLVSIFDDAAISDSDEKDFYLAEFDWNLKDSR